VNNTYKNGKLVEHEEKEMKDGKVLKNEKTTPQIGNGNNKTNDVDVAKLQLLIGEKDAKIKELENTLKKYQNENNELKNKFEKVKNLFN
jgi:ribosomal protein S3